MSTPKSALEVSCDYIRDAGKEIQHLREVNAGMLEALMSIPCPDCGHKLWGHSDKYGCQYDRGDVQVQEVGAVALGPCGCQLQDELMPALAAIRKAKGEL